MVDGCLHKRVITPCDTKSELEPDDFGTHKRTYDIQGAADWELGNFNEVIKPSVGEIDSHVSINLNVSARSVQYSGDRAGGPGFLDVSHRINDIHYIGGIRSQLKVDAWRYELSFEPDCEKRQFLSNGIAHGFRIVDSDKCIPVYDCPNYKSCYESKANSYLNRLFNHEVQEGKIIPTSSRPHCIHAIGAIPKSDGTYRPITDCRRPIDGSINNFMETTALPFKYKSLDDVCEVLGRGSFMCCTDIKSAYRAVPISPDHWKFQGFRWTTEEGSFGYLDTRLSFGLRCAPHIFNEISTFVTDCMARRGYYKVINYLDDYFCWGDNFQECADTQNCLIRLLGQLGFTIAWHKCSSPATKCVFLGVEIDSIGMTMSLPSSKLDRLNHELEFFNGRSRATVRQIQRLCGIMSYASRVIRGGRTFTRRVIDLLKNLPPGTTRVRLSTQFRADLDWWSRWAKVFNGHASMITHNYGLGPSINTDASKSGYGLLYGIRWCAGYFNSNASPRLIQQMRADHLHWLNLQTGLLSINVLELVPIWLACVLWGREWSGSQVICWTDNTQVLSAINKGSSTSAITMSLIRDIFWYSVAFDFHLVARHVPGRDNTSADFLSRMGHDTLLSDLNRYVSCCSKRLRQLG